jgi:hypothetical protein
MFGITVIVMWVLERLCQCFSEASLHSYVTQQCHSAALWNIKRNSKQRGSDQRRGVCSELDSASYNWQNAIMVILKQLSNSTLFSICLVMIYNRDLELPGTENTALVTDTVLINAAWTHDTELKWLQITYVFIFVFLLHFLFLLLFQFF